MSFLALCAVANAGAGVATLAIVLVGALAILQPIIQFGIICLREQPTKPWTAWAISLSITFVPVVVATVMGTFNFW